MDKDYIVSKSNYLIFAKYKLSLEEQRIILTLASMIQPDDEDFVTYKFKTKEFLELLDIKDNKKYGSLPRITKGLVDKSLEIHYEDGEKVLQASWLSSVEYKKGSGTIELEFSPKLRPFLLGLKRFYTSYKLENVLSLRSMYSIRLYEILKSIEYKKYSTLRIDELKKLLHIDPSKYKRLYDIKTKIIDASLKELAEKTDIKAWYEEIKEGRQVTELKFHILPNHKNKPNSGFAPELNSLKEKIDKKMNVKFSFRRLKILVQEKGIEKVEYYLENWNSFDCSTKSNVAGFFYKAVMEEWEIPKQGSAKPVQATNYEQRTYSDEELESLYWQPEHDNLKQSS